MSASALSKFEAGSLSSYSAIPPEYFSTDDDSDGDVSSDQQQTSVKPLHVQATSHNHNQSVSYAGSVSQPNNNSKSVKQLSVQDGKDYPDPIDTKPTVSGRHKMSVYNVADIQAYVNKPITLGPNPQFFVIKSYSEEDVYSSIKYGVWCSTASGNKVLSKAYKTNNEVYLLFSVNGSSQFCGVCRMTSGVDFEDRTGVWCKASWKGWFSVRWLFIKDVPHAHLRHITFFSPEMKEQRPVTNVRDCTGVPEEAGRNSLDVIQNYNSSSSIFDDIEHYEKSY